MDKKLFADLLEAVKEMKAIREGRAKPARVTRYKDLDPKAIRTKSGLTQDRFAALMGVKLATYRNWEQGRRVPHGPAQVLLMVADFDPTIVRKAIHAQREDPVEEESPAATSSVAGRVPPLHAHRPTGEICVKEAPAECDGRKRADRPRKIAAARKAVKKPAKKSVRQPS